MHGNYGQLRGNWRDAASRAGHRRRRRSAGGRWGREPSWPPASRAARWPPAVYGLSRLSLLQQGALADALPLSQTAMDRGKSDYLHALHSKRA